MKDKTEEIINTLFKSNLDTLKDESLDIDLSVCATIPITSSENDCSLDIQTSPPEFWAEQFYDDLNNINNFTSTNNNDNKEEEKVQDRKHHHHQQQQHEIANIDEHQNMKLIKCDHCCESFDNNESLKVHKLINHSKIINQLKQNNNKLKCGNCDNVFSDGRSLKKHSTIHHRKNETTNSRDAECPDCGKILKERSMWMHRKIHSDTKRFCCDHCGQKFVQKINFTHHMRIHTGENPYVCHECNKTFFSFSHLIRHQKYHSSARPFKCEICEKMYKTERCLKVHSLVHLDQRPFVCSVCNKSFISSSKLKQHLNIHTGERPYKCKYCSRDFTNFPNWLKHTRRRHKVDHKTGERLSIPTDLNVDKNKTQKSMKSTLKNQKTSSINQNFAINELEDYTTTNKSAKDFSSAVSITSTDDLIMEQALEMEEYFQVNPDDQALSDGFDIRKVKTENIRMPTTFSELKFDLSTSRQVLPSVETIFTSAALQRVKKEIKQEKP